MATTEILKTMQCRLQTAHSELNKTQEKLNDYAKNGFEPRDGDVDPKLLQATKKALMTEITDIGKDLATANVVWDGIFGDYGPNILSSVR
jgi:hypothetical protein